MLDPRSLRSGPCSVANTNNSLDSEESIIDFMFKVCISMLMFIGLASREESRDIEPQSSEIVFCDTCFCEPDECYCDDPIYYVYKYVGWYSAPLQCEIEPHSSEVSMKKHNVTFMDEAPGHTDTISGGIDDLRMGPMEDDASLEDFFSRPIKLGQYDWSTSTGTLDVESNIWRNLFADKRIVNRISNYKLLAARLHIKIVINGNPFLYGRLLAAYTPMSGFDDMTRTRTLVAADLVGLSQKPHVYLDPSTSQGGTLELPFCWWENTLDVTSDAVAATGTTDFDRIGKLTIKTVNNLRHTSGVTDSCNVGVFAWATDVKFAVPTQTNPAFITPQADEYTGSGIISKPATAVANYLSKVKAPVIQPYITATALAAKTVGAIASIFGYSRPVHLQSSRYQPNTKHNMSVSNLEDDAAKLSLDAKQELTIDPIAYGLSNQDEMSINYIASRESYVTTFPFPVTASEETMLFNMVVDPVMPVIYNTGTANELHLPAITFASLPFKKWRGGIKYRFQVVCSKFHRGRIKVVYDPSGNGDGYADYNVAYQTIVDISNTTDFEIVAGWGQSTTYRSMNDITNPTSLNYSTTPLFYDSNDTGYGNGTIAVYVVNELTVPSNLGNEDIEINVLMSACDDFEVAMPTGEIVTRMRLRDASEIAPQAEELNDNPTTGAPEHPYVADTLAATIPLTDPANLMHFGESIRSFRQLVKRYNQHEKIPLYNQGAGWAAESPTVFQLQRAALPFEIGYSPTAVLGFTEGVPVAIGTTPNAKFYAYGTMTLLRYLSTGFVGWRGSVRYLLDMGIVGSCPCKALGPVSVTRYSDCSPQNSSDWVPDLYTGAGQQSLQIVYDDVSGQEGMIVQNTGVNGSVAFEVPFYTEKRFMPARKLANFDPTGTNYGPCWKARATFFTGPAADQTLMRNATATTFVAAGEDFSLGFFIGAPVFFYEPIPP